MRALFLTGALALLGAVRGAPGGEFVPGHIYVMVSEVDTCDFGGDEAIIEIDPLTGETSIFADSSDGICVGSGLAFTPDGGRLRQLNAGHLLPPDDGWIFDFDEDGNPMMVFAGKDGVARPVGSNGLTFADDGDFYVVNTSPSQILRFPADGGSAEIFADTEDGIYDRGAIDFDPASGDLFYAGDLAEVILRITPDGEASVFDLRPADFEGLRNLVFDTAGNLFVGTFSHDGPTGNDYAIYRYDFADPQSRRLLVSGFSHEGSQAAFSTALAVSPDDSQLYFAVADWAAPGGFLYAVDPNDGSWTIMADFSVFGATFVSPAGIAVVDPPAAADCEGDANLDGTVDPLDSGYVLARFGCLVGLGDPDCDAADQNADGAVDPLDVGFVLARFGNCL